MEFLSRPEPGEFSGNGRFGRQPYNILLVVNQKYVDFTLILIRSILATCDMHRLGAIFIADIGMTSFSRRRVQELSSRIHFIDTCEHIADPKANLSNEWIRAVSLKARCLRFCVENDCAPLILMDVDQVVMKDFLADLRISAPVAVCKRKDPPRRADGQKLDFIASFFVANNAGALQFIDEWIRLMQERIAGGAAAPYETPALCDLLGRRVQGVDYEEVLDREYSSPNIYSPKTTRIVHYKGNDIIAFENIVFGRLEQVEGLSISQIAKYLYS